MKYIFDTSAIIVLLEICGLGNQLLRFSSENELNVPSKVAEEYLRGASNIDKSTFEKIFSVVSVDLEQELLPYFNFDSSSGEIWVISHACKHQDCCCVIDEEFGRSICELFKVRLTGAIGIIKEMKKQAFLSNKDLALVKRKIKSSQFYLSKKLSDELGK